MTLLAPMALLAGAALTVPVLITLYLLKLRRRPLTVSSTIFWQDQGRDLEVNVPLRMIRPTWMLLLHALVLGLLLLALGRPAIHGGPTAAERLFVLIDRSLSMNATDGENGLSRFELAQREARDYIASLERNGYSGRIALIAFGSSAELVAGPTRDPAEIRRGIELLEPTDQPGDLSAALRLVESLTQRSGEGETDGRVGAEAVLFGDGQPFGATPLSLAGAAFRFRPVGPASEQAATGLNAGIVASAAVRDYRDPSTIRVFVRAQSTRPGDTRLPVSVFVDGDRSRLVAVELTEETSEGGRIARSGAAAFTLERPEGAVIDLRLTGRDALRADDKASLVVAPARRTAIRLVRPTERADSDAAWLLEETLIALEPSSFELFTEESFPPDGGFAGLTVFDRVAPAEWPAGPSLSFGAIARSSATTLTPPEWPQTVSVAGWRRRDALLRDASLGELTIGGPAVFDATALERAPEVLAYAATGPLIVRFEESGATRAVVAFDLARSNWPLELSFPIFVANSADTLGSGGVQTGGSAAIAAGDPAEIPLRGEADSVQVRGVLHGGGTVELRAPARGSSRAELGVVPRAGLYTAEDGARPVAVNTANAAESALAVSPDLPVISAGDISGDTTGADDGETELWRWCVLAAVLLLGIEWWLFALRSRA
ncbi:MAG: BatA and WFA domain-containing protein [Planctomycetota bacterium]